MIQHEQNLNLIRKFVEPGDRRVSYGELTLPAQHWKMGREGGFGGAITSEIADLNNIILAMSKI